MEIGADLHTRLVQLISEKVPVAEKPEGRDMLLNGILNQNGWDRYPANTYVDIYKIIGYLKHYFTGDTEEIETWGLITFIDNARCTVAGTTTEKQLQLLRQQCVTCLEKEQLKQPQSTFSRDTNRPEQCPSPGSSPEQIQKPTLLSPSKSSSSEDDLVSQENSLPNFYIMITFLTQITLGVLESVEEPFHASSKASYVAKRRIALKRLEDVPQLLHHMGDYLEKTSTLPKAIVGRRHILKNQIYHLVEQIQAVRSWIDTSSEACQSILEKFEEIKQALIELRDLKGEDDTHQQSA